ncbi:hypothetical protein [Campylobacter sp. JMF_08 NE1]|uniref:hypothetical protein n=1 Tax=Campylobacter sp. JMF_08 NE1 TaxID=2983821 RepID=UPI0022E9E2A0|nr:hypothetical protein [Campylobacter sp. JMF_08 NE1]MDA3047269.1 hypothetical protein [Campylobacter sp. JMF_08 NE1]
MKKIILCSFVLSSVLFGADEPKGLSDEVRAFQDRYNGMFANLNKPRVGLSDSQIASLPDPFYPREANTGPVEPVVKKTEGLGYQLLGIMGNKVKLNDKWYGLGDYIGSYKIVQITGNSVIVANNEDNKIELKLKQGNQNVTITYK